MSLDNAKNHTRIEMRPSAMQLGRLYLSYERAETYDLQNAKDAFNEASAINKVITGPMMLLGHVALIEGNDNEASTFFKSVVD